MSTPGPPVTVFVVIANVQDQLSVGRWASFHAEVAEMIHLAGAVFQGEWFCSPVALWQNACWCIDVQPGVVERLKGELAVIGAKYGRGAVGWSEVAASYVLG